jgi:hypothetical protein
LDLLVGRNGHQAGQDLGRISEHQGAPASGGRCQ